MEKINVAELLENCPKGMELYSPIFGKVYLDKIRPHLGIRVTTDKEQSDIKEEFLYDGRYGINGECMLFPSKDKTSWEGFHRPFVDGDVAITNRGDIHLLRTADSSYCAYRARWEGLPKFDNKITTDIEVLRLATVEEKEILFQAIKDNGYKWNAEKKCLEKLEPQYPKTYKECCDILGLDTMVNDAQGYKWVLIMRLQELIICRDAYWKIAGEKMRLKKPWKPDYTIDEDGFGLFKFCIKNMGGKIKMVETAEANTILAFPTKEMRDAFYDNFKESIESKNISTSDALHHLLVWNYGLRGYTHVKFSYGYTKRTMTFEIDSIAIGKGKTEWGAPAEEVFKIKLGKRI